jgi:hypothetical protein
MHRAKPLAFIHFYDAVRVTVMYTKPTNSKKYGYPCRSECCRKKQQEAARLVKGGK